MSKSGGFERIQAERDADLKSTLETKKFIKATQTCIRKAINNLTKEIDEDFREDSVESKIDYAVSLAQMHLELTIIERAIDGREMALNDSNMESIS